MTELKNPQWVASTNDELFSLPYYKSKEEALEKAPHDLELQDGDSFYIGTATPFSVQPKNHRWFLEDLVEDNESLGEWSESWVDDLFENDEVKKFIDEKLQEIASYINEKNPAKFFNVGDIESHYAEGMNHV